MEAAQAWGTTPWEIANNTSEDAVLWFIRFREYRAASIEAEKERAKKKPKGP